MLATVAREHLFSDDFLSVLLFYFNNKIKIADSLDAVNMKQPIVETTVAADM